MPIRGGRQGVEHKGTITVAGGSGSVIFQKYGRNHKFNNELTVFIFIPTSDANAYKITFTDSTGKVVHDDTRSAHTGRFSRTNVGVQLIGEITANISSASIDEDVEVSIYVS